MGIPTMIGMLINALYNLVDAYFVGGLGECQMGAISVVYPLGQVVVGLGLLFGTGAASYISRLLGQRDKEQANTVASTALYSSLAVGAVIILLSVIFLNPILRLLGATESILPYEMCIRDSTCVKSFFFIFPKSIGSHSHNRNCPRIRMIQPTYHLCRLNPIHDGHSDIHKDHLIITRLSVPEAFHCYFTVFRHLNASKSS